MAVHENGGNWRAALRRVVPDRQAPDRDKPTDLAVELVSDQPSAAVERRVEEAVLQAPRRYSRRDVHALTGIADERARHLWRSLGFADVAEDDVMFTETDLAAIGRLEQLRATGLVSTDLQDAVIRSMAQAMSGLATWQVELLYQILRERQSAGEEWSVDLRELLTSLESLQNYVWRRHLAVAAGRLLATAPDEADIRTLVVGSSDLVGFTRMSRRLSPSQLIELVELFHGIAANVVADHRGRIVKTVGDAVLFVTDRPEDAAELGLDLIERTVAASGLPELRTGLAIGRTLTRFGDIYGEVVETASRLCTHARPGRVLVDHELAMALDGDPRFQLRLRRPLADRGYPRLHAWGLRRAESTE
ncbi:MAG TPA: adenylate/guanylate cyclase domain-containing protein [Pseudonocardia sp.]|jgi:adenylate cyclase|nr:adenylate/guanylate cyclase domain-containing protein [Pseudonocardia sp.]